MNKRYTSLTLTLTLALACALAVTTAARAQEDPFPWPVEELGEAMMIEPGDPGTINATINGDTLANGTRAHNVYILRRGATYLYTGRVNNVGHPLMVMAEEGDGALPIVAALGPPEGEDEAPRAFHAQGNLYLKDIHIRGTDQTGSPTDNATVRFAADSITVVLRGILFDYNRQNAIRINGLGCTLYAEDCIIGKQGNARNIEQGFGLNFRDQFTPLVHFRNCSFYALTKGPVENFGTARYGKMIIEHCTLVNSGIDGGEFGRPDSLIFTDNLMINSGILGDGYAGDRADFSQPLFAFSLDSNIVADTTFAGTDTTINFTYVEPYVEFERNHFYNKPLIQATLPDSSTSYMGGDIFVDEELTEDIVGGNNVISQEDFDFTAFAMPDEQFTSFIGNYYEIDLEQQEIPGFDNDITAIDLTFPTDHPAATAGRGGQPVGALTWWGLSIMSDAYDFQPIDIAVAPNPAKETTLVEMEDLRSVLIYDLNGRLVSLHNGLAGGQSRIDVSGLSGGTYVLVAVNGSRQATTHKLVKR